MTEKIDVYRLCRVLSYGRYLRAYLGCIEHGTRQRPESAGLTDRNRHRRAVRTRQRSLNDRQVNTDQMEQPAIWPHRIHTVSTLDFD